MGLDLPGHLGRSTVDAGTKLAGCSLARGRDPSLNLRISKLTRVLVRPDHDGINLRIGTAEVFASSL